MNVFGALMKHHVLLAIQAKLKLANYYNFLVAIDSRAKSWHKCGKSSHFEVQKRCYIQIYPTEFLLCYVKVIDLQHM